jgi:hypothetical protein
VELTRHETVMRPEGADLVDASVGPSGDLIALWRKQNNTYMITGSVELEVPRLSLRYPLVQPLSDGRVLLVGARARTRENNALVFDANGELIAEAAFGDGIEHVLTTSDDHAWVGYFDEGVYGDGGPAGHGLVRFDPELRLNWTFPFHQQTPIDDCYALNVSDRAVWTCYYSGFPVARVRNGEVRSWRNDIAGAKALAVAGSTVALVGGYGPETERLVVGYLDGECVQVVQESTLPVTGYHVTGRGPEINAINPHEWKTWSLAY